MFPRRLRRMPWMRPAGGLWRLAGGRRGGEGNKGSGEGEYSAKISRKTYDTSTYSYVHHIGSLGLLCTYIYMS